MDDIVNQLLEEVKMVYLEKQKLTEDVLLSLSYVFDNCLTQALDLIDRKSITHIISPSGRSLYQVQGKANVSYICLAFSNYCSCPAFKFSVLKKGQYTCKHKLAVLLSQAMNVCKEVRYSDDTIALMLAGLQSTLVNNAV